jgi:putative aminopeptidase FrvX
MQLLKTLCTIHAPAGQEEKLTEYLLNYIEVQKTNWKTQPIIHAGKGFQNCIVLAFGKPTTAIFAHIDSIGFTVRYGKELIKLGGPVSKDGTILVGEDSKGAIECILKKDKNKNLTYQYHREIDRGTNLTFKPDFRETDETVQCCYLDNRLGVYSALKVAETLENGIIVFSCWEETGGGSVEYLTKFIFEEYGITQTLISDITWVTEGVEAGKGCAISMRDSGIPRRSYVSRIIDIAKQANIPFQLEVESSGGSDGNVINGCPYPIDWCFVGAPEDHVHSPDEIVHKADIKSMITLYKELMIKL